MSQQIKNKKLAHLSVKLRKTKTQLEDPCDQLDNVWNSSQKIQKAKPPNKINKYLEQQTK